MLKIVVFCLLGINQLWPELVPLFIPPSAWQYARPKNPSEYVHVSFILNGTFKFRPSINLATEKIDVSLKEYVQAVKEIHLKEPNTKWHDLGKFTMKGGVGRLTEISSQTPYGEVKILQAILIHKKMAYILTATALKNEFSNLLNEILSSLQSLSLQEDIFSAVQDHTKQKKLQDLFATLGHLPCDINPEIAKHRQTEKLQQEILNNYPEMGSHWQYLALKEGLLKIHGP